MFRPKPRWFAGKSLVLAGVDGNFSTAFQGKDEQPGGGSAVIDDFWTALCVFCFYFNTSKAPSPVWGLAFGVERAGEKWEIWFALVQGGKENNQPWKLHFQTGTAATRTSSLHWNRAFLEGWSVHKIWQLWSAHKIWQFCWQQSAWNSGVNYSCESQVIIFHDMAHPELRV